MSGQYVTGTLGGMLAGRRHSAAPRWIVRVGGVVAALVLGVACSDGGSDGAGAPSTSVQEPVQSAPASTASGPQTSVVDVPTTVGEASTSTTIVPDSTGVPGVESEVPTCAAFAQLNGTFQLLAIAAAFGGGDPVGLARVELVAAPAVVAAADALASSWPADLEEERSIVQDDLVGPIDRRAERAVQALRDAGAADTELAELATAWQSVLAAQERDNPEVVLPALSAATDAVLAAAAEKFAADVTSYGEDPSLLRGNVPTPLTDAWLTARCPEVLASSGSDAV